MTSPRDHFKRAQNGKDEWNRWARDEWPAWAKNETDAGRSSTIRFSNRQININFSDFVFPGDVDFGDGKPTFPSANFERAIFKGAVSFGGWGAGDRKGKGATFEQPVSFIQATFENGADFTGVTFKSTAKFWGTTFQQHALFNSAIFEERAEFNGSNFKGNARFTNAEFKGDARFEASFEGDAEFSEIVAVGPPDFRAARFAIPPKFHKSQITYRVKEKENGLWRRWFKCADTDSAAPRYRRLKQLAGDAKDHESELDFFALELKAKRFHETKGFGPIALNVAYDWLSDYGRSIGRPTLWLLLSLAAAMAAITYAYSDTIFLPMRTSKTLEVAGITSNWLEDAGKVLVDLVAVFHIALSNSALLLGSDKWAMRANAFTTLRSPGFNVVGDLLAYVQSGFSLLLLFLIGLGLRNRFRVGTS